MAYFAKTVFPDKPIGTDEFILDFTYVSTDEIVVEINGTPTTAYSWLNDTTIKLDTPLAEESDVVIRRDTSLDERKVDFVNTAELDEADLDNANIQLFNKMQETADAQEQNVKREDDGTIDMQGKRIVNAGGAVDADDLVTKSAIDGLTSANVAEAAASAAASAASAVESAVSAALAESYYNSMDDKIMITPSQHGAFGDGVTNDINYLNDTLDAAAALSGVSAAPVAVYLQGKTYAINNNLRFDETHANLHLFGGKLIPHSTWVGGIIPLIKVQSTDGSNVEGVTLSHLVLDAEATCEGIKLDAHTNTTIESCYVVHFNTYCIQSLTKGTELRIKSTTVGQFEWGEAGWNDDSLRTAKGFQLDTSDWWMENCVGRYCKYPFHRTAGGGGHLVGCHFYNPSTTGTPVNVYCENPGFRSLVFSHCIFDNAAIHLKGDFTDKAAATFVAPTFNYKNGSLFIEQSAFTLEATTANSDAKGFTVLYPRYMNVSGSAHWKVDDDFIKFTTSGVGTWKDELELTWIAGKTEEGVVPRWLHKMPADDTVMIGNRSVKIAIDERVNVKDYGAVGDGIADDTTAITAALVARAASGAPLIIPAGSYLYNGTVYQVDDLSTWMDSNFSTGVNPISSAQNSNVLLTGSTPTDAVQDVTKSRVLLSSTVEARGGQHGSAARFNLINRSTDGNGCTAVYARATNVDGTVNWGAALHGETRHGGGTSIGVSSENASYATTGALIGVVAHNTTAGAEATHPISGAAKATCENAYGVYVHGSEEVAPNQDRSKWKYGAYFTTHSVRSGGIVIYSTANAATFMSDDGTHDWGILLNGTYNNGAIRVPADTGIALENTGVVQMKYSSGDLAYVCEVGGTNVFEVKTSGAGSILGKGTGEVHASINGGAGSGRSVRCQTNGVNRWQMGADAAAEVGSDFGSDYAVQGYADDGTWLGKYMVLTRANGNAWFKASLQAYGNGTFGNSTAASAQTVTVRGQAGYNRAFQVQTGTTNRWAWGANGSPESGSDVGSDFFFGAYSDAGAWLGSYLTIVRSNGSVKVANILQMDGGRIQFPATQVPSTDARTLDDYEESNPTLTLEDGTGNQATIATQNCDITKIGNVVMVNGYIELSSLGSMTGNILYIKGLSHTARNTYKNATVQFANVLNVTPAQGFMEGTVIPGTSTIRIYKGGTTAGSVAFPVSDLSATTSFSFSATYHV